ncbi:MAG: site-specific integrase, partial [Gammaproteobacteria bacterium]|nr:site-specific integrase [Gammaproteobacteria bacterium]
MEFFARTNREFFDRHKRAIDCSVRIDLAAIAFLHGWFRDFQALGTTQRRPLANRVFGKEPVSAAIDQALEPLAQWGYSLSGSAVLRVVCDALLRNESPYLDDLTIERLRDFRNAQTMKETRRNYFPFSRVLFYLGILKSPLERGPHTVRRPDSSSGVPREWCEWVDRWSRTSTILTRKNYRKVLYKVGRWLAENHPEIVSPDQWTRQTAAEFVAEAVRMRVGDYTVARINPSQRGLSLAPSTIALIINTVRGFFSDCQQWDWIPRRFDPARSIVTPPSILGQLGPKPRVISDDIWARLLWAGLNVSVEDIPRSGRLPRMEAQ